MAKSPRKSAKSHQRGGKNLKSYKQRRFSIAESTSSSPSESDSDSSLTAVSERDDVEASRKGSLLYNEEDKQQLISEFTGGKKRIPKKTVNWDHYQGTAISSSDEDDEDEIPAENLYSMMKGFKSASDDNNDDEEEEEEEEEDSNSSSDDSDIDFVQLQAERKAKSIKAVRAMKGLHKEDDKKTNNKKRRSSSVSKPKFGRRKSQAALPDDINFTFEFGDNKLTSAIDDDDEEERKSKQEEKSEESEEDFGEEVKFDDKTSTSEKIEEQGNYEFDFETPLVQVPKFKEDELNSDDDYEIDDNELLATLQADNDLDEFDTKADPQPATNHIRKNLTNSLNDDDDNDPFLKEEEKFLVNEFENNGFDDEENFYNISNTTDNGKMIESFNSMSPSNQVIQYASSDDDDNDEDEEDDYVDIIDFSAPFYARSDSFTSSPEKKTNAAKVVKSPSKSEKKSKKKKRNHKISSVDSDEEDDSYLWNYFFSSDKESDDDEDDYESDLIQTDFKDSENPEDKRKKLLGNVHYHYNTSVFESEEEYDSGESTDVDLSLPTSNESKFGSKVAKEVLSSKTADYRPPVLGTWVAIDSKPFGIIDGLSTRTLTNISNTNNRNLDHRQKMRKSIINDHNGDLAMGLDELLNISELDNADENDVRIWRDFNSQKKQVPLGAFRNKSILNNSMIHPDSLPINYNHTSNSNNEFNKRRYSLTRKNSVSKKSSGVKKSNPAHKNSTASISTKMKRRRASIVEAVSEGYRPTKSGVFSEHALADVEEVLGDDVDLMALIKGL